MTDARAETTPFDEDRLPWLEAVEEDGASDGPSALRLIVAVLIGLAAIGAVVGGIFWIYDRYRTQQTGGAPELIEAPEGAYKVRPDDPGGMQVEGEGDTAQQASQGADPKGSINTNGVAEAPLGQGAQPQPNASAQPGIIPAPPPTNGQPAAAGATIQLGAFSSQAGASSAWTALSKRFSYLSPLTHSVVPVTRDGKTLYRLRAGGPGAENICGRLRVAGETCTKVD